MILMKKSVTSCLCQSKKLIPKKRFFAKTRDLTVFNFKRTNEFIAVLDAWTHDAKEPLT